MLFNSAEFLFVFLPAALLAYHLLGRYVGFRAACASLVFASLFYYGWWNPKYLLVLVPATLANAALGQMLCSSRIAQSWRRRILWLGLVGNLALLAYFKYAGFLAVNLNAALGTNISFGDIVLPLGISFFIFQKIAFLVDAYKGLVRRFDLLNFFLFVMFFPQLIAGPIVHHREVMPQFAQAGVARFNSLNFSIGITIFAVGLFKKMVIADTCGSFASPIFDGFMNGGQFTPAAAWFGAVAYAFQLYFDFSGYSDMAVGLARMFNVDLPINFNSPYKALNITDFWRRWHITLSRFLRDYLYFPLGGNRKGPARRYLNLMVTMLLGGLWHGASWSFVLWGGAHGLMLATHHAWRALMARLGWSPGKSALGRFAAGLLTFTLVVTAWVLFRMPELDPAVRMIRTMYSPDLAESLLRFAGRQGQDLLRLMAILAATLGVPVAKTYDFQSLQLGGAWLAAVAIVAFRFPNVYQVFGRYRAGMPEQGEAPSLAHSSLHWGLSARWAAVTSLLAGTALMQLGKVTPFLYFQF